MMAFTNITSSNDKTNTMVRIELFPLFERLFECNGASKPEMILKEKNNILSKVVITFDGAKIPCKKLHALSSDQHSFFGDDPRSAALAEHNAVMAAVERLRECYAIEIHDISRYKLALCKARLKEVYVRNGSFSSKALHFLHEYERSCELLSASCQPDARVLENSLDDLYSSLNEAIQSATMFVEEFKGKLFAVERETNARYIEASDTVTSNNTLKPPPVVWKISEKELLSSLVKYLGYGEPKYSHTLSANDKFIGMCKLCVVNSDISIKTGATVIAGDEKENAHDAECNAAAKAFGYLERSRSIEIVDFNYDLLQIKKQKLNELMHCLTKYCAVVSEANASWCFFMARIKEMIKDIYAVRKVKVSLKEDPSILSAIIAAATELENVLSNISNIHCSALSEVCQLLM